MSLILPARDSVVRPFEPHGSSRDRNGLMGTDGRFLSLHRTFGCTRLPDVYYPKLLPENCLAVTH